MYKFFFPIFYTNHSFISHFSSAIRNISFSHNNNILHVEVDRLVGRSSNRSCVVWDWVCHWDRHGDRSTGGSGGRRRHVLGGGGRSWLTHIDDTWITWIDEGGLHEHSVVQIPLEGRQRFAALVDLFHEAKEELNESSDSTTTED